MKGIYVVAVLCAAVLAASQEIKPWTCDPDDIYHLPHENDCASYYVCFLGVKFLQKCDENLRFSPTLSTCIDALDVPCPPKFGDSDEFESDKTMVDSPASCIGTCPSRDPLNYTVLLPNDDCRKFCMCSNGVAYIMDCPADLHFDSIEMVCDYPASAVCGTRPTTGPPYTTTTTTGPPYTTTPTTEQPCTSTPYPIPPTTTPRYPPFTTTTPRYPTTTPYWTTYIGAYRHVDTERRERRERFIGLRERGRQR